MKKSNISKRLGEIEEYIGNIHTDKKTEDEYRLWNQENPLSDWAINPNWSIETWLDNMPKQFKPYFIRDMLSMFPHLKRGYRSGLIDPR